MWPIIDSVRYCFSAAASMATELVREWKKQTGLNIHEAHGMTANTSMVTYNLFSIFFLLSNLLLSKKVSIGVLSFQRRP
jgi:hypothetical protein